MPKQRISALLVVVALAGAACTTTDEAATGGTLVAAISSEPDQLDTHLTTAYASFQVLENVYDTLVQPNEQLEFEPALATEWTTSEDGLTWTFTLRDGVTWHDGTDFTADDVVASYNRILDEDVGAANAFRFATVEEVRAVDDLTVEISLTEPTPNLLANIGGFKGMSIVPAAEIEAGTVSENLIGTGPFTFVEFNEGQGIMLEANEDYWGEGPFLDAVEYRFLSEGTTALTELRTPGGVQWTDNIPAQQVANVLQDAELESNAVPSNDYWYFAFNNEREPFDDVRVRQALGGWGIDREAITQGAKFDAATPTQTAIPAGSFWRHEYSPYSHDVGRAQQLLDEAGVSNLAVDLMVTNEFEETVQAAQVIESQWGELGVDVNIQTLDFGAWLDRQGQGRFDVFLLGWLGNIDPHGFYFAQHHSEGNFNFHGYSNPEVDRLLDEARVETDQGTRKSLYDQAATIIVDEVSYAYMYNPDVVQAWRPEVEGYTVRPDRAIRFERVRLS